MGQADGSKQQEDLSVDAFLHTSLDQWTAASGLTQLILRSLHHEQWDDVMKFLEQLLAVSHAEAQRVQTYRLTLEQLGLVLGRPVDCWHAGHRVCAWPV